MTEPKSEGLDARQSSTPSLKAEQTSHDNELQVYPIRLGLVCIVRELRPYGIYSCHTATIGPAEAGGLSYVYDKVQLNLQHLMTSLVYCDAHGIRFYRISSDLLPLWSTPGYSQSGYDLRPFRKLFKEIGRFAHDRGIRLTMHPDQMLQIGAEREEVYQNTVGDLEKHYQIMKMLGHKPKEGSVFILHGGGTYGDRTATLRRWEERWKQLPSHIRPFICLENDEFSYGVDHLLPFCERLGIPFCLDFFHNKISHDQVIIDLPLLIRIKDTWKNHGGIPKFHFSRQEPNERRGRHSETVQSIPRSILHIPRLLRCPVDIMIEAKDKDISVNYLHHKYFDMRVDETGHVEHLLKEEYR